MTSLYDTLGVSPESDAGEIKSAYRKKAQASHPDRPKGDAEVFHAIQKAYDILGNEEKRKRYDETGETTDTPSDEDVASGFLVEVFNMLIANLEETKDFIKSAKEFVSNEKRGVGVEVFKGKSALAKLKRLSGRVKTKEQNLFQGLLEQKIIEIDQRITLQESRMGLCDLALKMLETYNDDVPQSQSSPTLNPWSSAFSSISINVS